MSRVILLSAILLAAAAQARAAVDDCVGIDTDLDRLACYDRESGRVPHTTMKETAGKWNVSVETSDFKDTTDVFLRLESDDVVSCGRYRAAQEVSLLIRCKENTTALFIAADCHLTSSDYDGYGDVDVRLDDTPSTTISMDASTNNRSLGLWSGGRAIPFIKAMLGKDVLITRFTPYGESPVTAKFQITGLDKAITPLRESCGW